MAVLNNEDVIQEIRQFQIRAGVSPTHILIHESLAETLSAAEYKPESTAKQTFCGLTIIATRDIPEGQYLIVTTWN